MDSARRRKKQQEKKSSPSNIRRKRSTSKTQRSKTSSKSRPKKKSSRSVNVRSGKKATKKKYSLKSRTGISRNPELKIKDGWIKFLILIFIVANFFLIYNLIKQWSTPKASEKIAVPEDDVAVQEKKKPVKAVDSAPLQIEVLNGCGVSGIAAEFTEFLRQEGFDVVKTENYESFNVLETVIIDRRGRSERIKEIARSLGLDTSRILKEINEAYLIDATIILGKDYRQIASWKKMEHNGY